MVAATLCRRAVPLFLRALLAGSLATASAPPAPANAVAPTPDGRQRPAGAGTEGRRGGERRANFEARGVRVGERVNDLAVYTLEGAPRRLASLWRERPLLLVTASITCPPSRSSLAEVQSIAERFGDRLAVAVLYTLEAHPVGEASPYRPAGPEWVPPINVRAGFERRQPKSLEARLELARELAWRFALRATVIVDGLDNEAWAMLGGGPNMGFLIATDGTVAVKHGWLDGPTMARSIEAALAR